MPGWLTDPIWLAVIVPVLLAVLGLLARGVRTRRAARPRMLFRTIMLMEPGEHTRGAYTYAVRAGFENTAGEAHYLVVFLGDPEEGDVYAEVVTRPVLRTGDRFVDDLGLRLIEQSDDPTHEVAEAFLRRALLMVITRDRFKRWWLFAPGFEDGGRMSAADFPWGDHDPQTFFHQYPTRAAALQALGNPWLAAARKGND